MYQRILQKLIKKSFPFWQAIGVHVTLNHFYEPIPDTRDLKKNIWYSRLSLPGIDFNEKEQLKLLKDFYSKYKKEYSKFPQRKDGLGGYYINNGMFECVDGEVLYCMVRYFKPKRIIELGSGYSTLLIAQAIAENKKEDSLYVCLFTVIDPYPYDIFKNGKILINKLIKKRVQDIDSKEFMKLNENDMIFIDSSHVCKIGSDVQYEFSEILPRLNKGVVVHFHDIFLPSEYPKEVILKEYTFWNEQYILQSFLQFNQSFKILLGASFMHLKYPEKLEKIFLTYNKKKHWPGSFWIQKIK